MRQQNRPGTCHHPRAAAHAKMRRRRNTRSIMQISFSTVRNAFSELATCTVRPSYERVTDLAPPHRPTELALEELSGRLLLFRKQLVGLNFPSPRQKKRPCEAASTDPVVVVVVVVCNLQSALLNQCSESSFCESSAPDIFATMLKATTSNKGAKIPEGRRSPSLAAESKLVNRFFGHCEKVGS